GGGGGGGGAGRGGGARQARVGGRRRHGGRSVGGCGDSTRHGSRPPACLGSTGLFAGTIRSLRPGVSDDTGARACPKSVPSPPCFLALLVDARRRSPRATPFLSAWSCWRSPAWGARHEPRRPR